MGLRLLYRQSDSTAIVRRGVADTSGDRTISVTDEELLAVRWQGSSCFPPTNASTNSISYIHACILYQGTKNGGSTLSAH